MVERVDGAAPQHRYLGAHRLREDDADGAGSVLHGSDPRDPRGEGQGRRWRQDGLHGLGEGEGNHNSVCCHLLHLEGL